MTAVLEHATSAEVLERIPLDQLHASPDNPRASVGDVAELAGSIVELGVIEPLVVAPRPGGGYDVIAGHRRLAACLLAEVADAPCIVRADVDETTQAEMRLVENLHRQDLSPLEEAAAYQSLIDLGHSQRKLATRVSRSQAHVSRRLSLLKLPAKALDALDTGNITVEQATTLARIDRARVTELFKRGQPSDWDIRDAVRRQELDEKMAAATKELADAGVTVVEAMPGPAWRHRLVERGNYGLEISPSEHASEPCHAGLVERNGAVTYVCTDPDRHGPAGESPVKESARGRADEDDAGRPPSLGEARWEAREDPEWQAQESAASERMERRKAAVAARREWIGAHLVEPADAGMAVDLVALVAAECYSIEEYFEDVRVLDLLGIALDTYGGGSRLDAVRAYMAKGSRNRARAVAAGAAIVLEAYVTPADWSMRAETVRLMGEDEDIARLWFRFLAEHGYEMSDYDREVIPEPEPPAEAAPEGTVAWYDDPEEGPRWVDAGEAAAIEFEDADRVHRLAPEDLPIETATAGESITGGCLITVEKPSRSKKWKWSCSCGAEGTKTTEAYAREMGDLHLAEGHPPAEVPA